MGLCVYIFFPTAMKMTLNTFHESDWYHKRG